MGDPAREPASVETSAVRADQMPEPKHGAGVRVLEHMLRTQGNPEPRLIAHVMKDFPGDRDAMLAVLHRTVGNAIVQQVMMLLAPAAAAPEQPAAPAIEAAPAPAVMPAAAMPELAPPAPAQTAPVPAATQATQATQAAVDPKHRYDGQAWATSREFDQLDPQQRRMIDELRPGQGALLWDELDAKHRAGFLNVTAVMKANGFPLDGLSLMPADGSDKSGLQQDRLLFTAETAGRLKGPLDAAIREREARGDRGFIEDKPENNLHPGMGAWGGRQWVTRFSMQVGGGSAGGFVDIDEFGPKVDVVGTVGHGFEVLRNKLGHHKTDPFTVARGLHKRGDEP